MARRERDPRVVEVLAAFQRHATSPARDGSTLDTFMHAVAGTAFDRFSIPGGWSDDAVRAVLLAVLLNAPFADLKDMLVRARKELVWLAGWEAESLQSAAHDGKEAA